MHTKGHKIQNTSNKQYQLKKLQANIHSSHGEFPLDVKAHVQSNQK